jgi:hypothetical protein
VSAVHIARTVFVVALAASRSPAVRAAIRSAPNLLTEDQKAKAVAATRQAAYNAGLLASRLVPRDRSSS